MFGSELECLSINLSGFIFFIYLVFQQQYFYEDDDRIVPSTPTLPPPRSDGFAEAIQYVFLPLHFVVVVFLLLSQMTDSFCCMKFSTGSRYVTISIRSFR